MPAKGSGKLNDFRTRQRLLQLLRSTGRYDVSAKALRMNIKTIERYRDANPDFDEACFQAKAYHGVQQELKHGSKLRQAAFDRLLGRIKDGTVSDAALIRILFTSNENPVV